MDLKSQLHEPPAPLVYTFHNDFQTVLTITHSEKHILHPTQFTHAYICIHEIEVLCNNTYECHAFYFQVYFFMVFMTYETDFMTLK